jgi:peptidoglycan-N-acetylglucosamine deacetylase
LRGLQILHTRNLLPLVAAVGALIATVTPAAAAETITLEGQTAIQGAAELTWNAVGGATRYVVQRDGVRMIVTTTSATDWVAGRLGGSHAYTVRAQDDAGSTLGSSASVEVAVDPQRYPWAGVVVHNAARTQPRVALTFDDCYNTSNVRQIVSVLRQKAAAGTFFCVGEAVAKAPATFADLATTFPLANHTWNHPNLNLKSRAGIVNQITRTTDAIELATGRPMTALMRPPGGRANATTAAVLGEMGLLVVKWDIDTRDWESGTTSTMVLNTALSARNGSVVLMHDRAKTVAALPKIISGLRKRGFELVTVNDLFSVPRGA